MRKRHRSIEIFNLSFLDVVSCGFGAIVLLLVISKISQPLVEKTAGKDLRAELVRLETGIDTLRRQSRTLISRLEQTDKELASAEEQFTAAASTMESLDKNLQDATAQSRALEILNQKLNTARQDLTREMRRLQPLITPAVDQPIGGVPVDSEYIIFIIDTSGSMQKFAWPLVRKKMAEILDSHPTVKGLQVLNDMGDYMFSQYTDRWIPDTPARRKAVLKILRSWSPFSNSSPVEGTVAAIRRFYSTDKKISIYIFGDDFSRGSIQDVVNTVSTMNLKDKTGSKRVRIHAIGFPVLFIHADAEDNLLRFSALMRRLAGDNNGSFVGLTSLRD